MEHKFMFVKQCAAICLLSGLSYAGDTIPASEQSVNGQVNQTQPESEFQATRIIAEAAADAETCTGLYGISLNSAFMASETFDINEINRVILGTSLGTLANGSGSDDAYADIGAQAIDNGSWVSIDSYGTSSNPANPTSLEVSYEFDIAISPNLDYYYKIQVYNWDDGKYITIVPSTQISGFGTDRIVTATITSGVAPYINPNTNAAYTGRVASRIVIHSLKIDNEAYPIFTARFDNISWTLDY